jgi:hypothetical protein
MLNPKITIKPTLNVTVNKPPETSIITSTITDIEPITPIETTITNATESIKTKKAETKVIPEIKEITKDGSTVEKVDGGKIYTYPDGTTILIKEEK